MAVGIDPKVDYAFKWLFGRESSTGILIDLLHAVLSPPPEEQIVEIRVLNPFSEKMALDDKLAVLDIKARDQRGRRENWPRRWTAGSTPCGTPRRWTQPSCPSQWHCPGSAGRWML